MWRPRRRPAARTSPDTIAVLGLLLLAWVPYLNTLGNSFVYDDIPQLVDNPYVHSFRYLGKIFGSTVWTFQGAQGVTNYYRPLMSFSYLDLLQLVRADFVRLSSGESRFSRRRRAAALRAHRAPFRRPSFGAFGGWSFRLASHSHGIGGLDRGTSRPRARLLFSADVSLLLAPRPREFRAPRILEVVCADARELRDGPALERTGADAPSARRGLRAFLSRRPRGHFPAHEIGPLSSSLRDGRRLSCIPHRGLRRICAVGFAARSPVGRRDSLRDRPDRRLLVEADLAGASLGVLCVSRKPQHSRSACSRGLGCAAHLSGAVRLAVAFRA